MKRLEFGVAVVVTLTVSAVSGAVTPPDFTHELWGRTIYGDGYVYGPAFRSSGVTVVDIDMDGDNDIVLPAFRSAPQIMRNLGSSRSFYPGGPRDLNIPAPGAGKCFNRYMDFADVNGDGRPDFLVGIDDFGTGHTSIVLYTNAGPADSPAFASPVTIYTSALSITSLGPINCVDIDGDALKDLCFIEFHMETSVRSHRLYKMKNIGTNTVPVWSAPEQITELSDLMPPRYLLSKSEQGSPFTPWLTPKEQALRRQKSAYDPRVFDFEFADWDEDGDMDFLFYDTERGVDWVRNLGWATIPVWDSEINGDGTRPYTQPDNLGRIFGSFAVRSGAFNPDFYVSIRGRLLTWRFNNVQHAYEIVQQNTVAYETGQGAPAFWDYDGDGDLDMFTTGMGGNVYGALLLFENEGTPYEPVWGDYSVINSVTMDIGGAANGFRQDAIVFDDFNLDGYADFLEQRQAGAIWAYQAYAPFISGSLPTFTNFNADVGSLWSSALAGESGIEPRGLAIGNFSQTAGSPKHQIITAFATASGGRLFFIMQGSSYFSWNTAIDISTLLHDELGQPLELNRIESMAATDLDNDGRPDLVLTLSDAENYLECSQHYYRNTTYIDSYGDEKYYFPYSGRLDAPFNNDKYHARMIAFADVDTDGDDDLFIGHQYYDPAEPDLNLNRYPYLRFYRNGSDTGLNYWQTRVVSGQTWRYYIGGTLPNYQYVLDASGGDLTGGVYTAGPTSQVVDIIQSTNATTNYRIYVEVLPTVGSESKAIILIGGAADDPLYPTFRDLAKTAYSTLLLQGLQKQYIRLFASGTLDANGDGANDVYADRTLAGLQQSIVTWANGSQRLLVYLVDHGQRNRFRINAVDYLEASTYADWVNQLQSSTPNSTVTTVIDMCEAGSFIPHLALLKGMKAAGAQRITITGSGVGPTKGVALFDQVRALSFSLPFWQEIYTGGAYGRAFDTARVAIGSINPLQQPQIDDSGNGIADEANDGLLADSSRAGADFVQPSSGVYIGEVVPNQPISSNTATLWLSDVVSSFPVEAAGALIVPPNLGRAASSTDDEQPLTGLAWVDFTYNDTLKRWQAPYTGFTQGGLYRVQYYVKALGRYYASPRIGAVDRINTPDAWETDNTSDSAKWLPINLSQGHNFHVSGDTDWIRFMAPANNSATIAVLPEGPNCQPRARLYKKSTLDGNPSAAPVRDVTSSNPGQEVEFTQSFGTSEQYLLRITNANNAFGAGTSYLVIIAVGTGGIIPPSLVVSVLQAGTNTPIGGAAVQASGPGSPFNNVTSSDGVAQFVCTNDETYSVTATMTGFQSASQSVVVNNQIETATLFMTPTGTPTATLNLSANQAGVKATIDGTVYDLPQALVLTRNVAHSVSVPQAITGYIWSRWSDGVTSAARSITLTGNLSLTAQYVASGHLGDVDGSGHVDAVDVQLVINGALGLAVAYNTDMNGSGNTDAVDVQLVINAALAG
ncbi:MAG: hypothetical protein HZB26_11625 [Candidatus Hydrogenedentes bacterium]|nr:hypothetical protein [Candidatus Hydrogenedentota bacterium]